MARQLLAVLHKGKLQGKGPLHSCPRAGKGNQESALLLLALISITQKQAGTHTRLEPPQSYQGLLLVNASSLLCVHRSSKSASTCGETQGCLALQQAFLQLGPCSKLQQDPPPLLPSLPSLLQPTTVHEWCERTLSDE